MTPDPSTDLSPEVLSELERLVEVATRGPWEIVGDEQEAIGSYSAADDGNIVCVWPYAEMAASIARWPDNAALICKAIAHLPALIAAAKREAGLREALEEIATAKPQKVADGFVQGPAVLWKWAQRLARAATAQQEEAKNG